MVASQSRAIQVGERKNESTQYANGILSSSTLKGSANMLSLFSEQTTVFQVSWTSLPGSRFFDIRLFYPHRSVLFTFHCI